MSSPYSSALASVPPDFLPILTSPAAMLCVYTRMLLVEQTDYEIPPQARALPRARRCFGTAYPLLFFLFWLCGCYSLCLQKHALGLHTAQKGPKCPSNDRVRNAPSTQGPRHVPRAWHCFGKAYPLLFFLFWLCSCYSPCTEGCPWSGGVQHVNRVGRC